jgi:mannose-6-phosphate isomerase-like protein (cupin superfamily)
MTPTDIRHLPTGAGRAFGLTGSSLSFKHEPGPAGDGPLLFEHLLPASLGVPPHRERNHEAFYVLEGTLEVETESGRYALAAGDFLGIPPGMAHSLHNPGPGPVRVLTMVSPGSGHARFFSTAGEPIDDPRNPPPPDASQDPEQIVAIARDCGIEFLPPPEA